MSLDHPNALLDFYIRAIPRNCILEFSKYVYRPRSTIDDREYFQIPGSQVAQTVPDLMKSLAPDQELAIHSLIQVATGRTVHIPMLDLMGTFQESYVKPIAQMMHEFKVPEFAVFNTGRSAHIYGLGLLEQQEVIRFFGRSLLLNLPDEPAIVDSRWVGHRTMAGYGSLRLTCNTKQYLQLPTLAGKFKS